MTEPCVLQGRRIDCADVAQVRELILAHPDWSRYRLSRELCTLWNWRNQVGQCKDMAARTFLSKLAQRGWIELPAARAVSPNRHRLRAVPTRSWDTRLLCGSLHALGPLSLREVSQDTQGRTELKAALAQFHYLGYRTSVGANLQYAVHNAQGRLLAVAVFGAAAWKCAPRDQWIGWSPSQRQAGLEKIANNSRFLILPWVQTPHLASWILSRMTQRLALDWQAKYGHRIELLETFVERDRFRGTCYRAANWRALGSTTGRSRQDRQRTLQVPVKEVYVQALREDFRVGLGL